MRKMIAIIFVLICVLSLTGCNEEKGDNSGVQNPDSNLETAIEKPVYSLEGKTADEIVSCVMALSQPLDLSQKINYNEFQQKLKDEYSRRNEDEYFCDELSSIYWGNIEEEMDGSIGVQSEISSMYFSARIHLKDYETASRVYQLLFEQTKHKYENIEEDEDGTWWTKYGWVENDHGAINELIVELKKKTDYDSQQSYYCIHFYDYF